LIQFIINNTDIHTSEKEGTTLLDFIRYHQQLTGTKIGCREGDCGACTVVIGEWDGKKMNYLSVTSCLTPIGNVHGKHVLSIEGINKEEGLNRVQQAMSDAAATQCGFCTIGFEMSLTAFALNYSARTKDPISAIDGNICRCTGYKSIERAAHAIESQLASIGTEVSMEQLIANDFLPAYFTDIPARLQSIEPRVPHSNFDRFVGGGTDLYVQKHDEMHDAQIQFLSQQHAFKGIQFDGNVCKIGAATTVSELMQNEALNTLLPDLYTFSKLVSSTPIRNIATLAGNFTNASPIGDFSIFFLALPTTLLLSDGTQTRSLPLNEYFLEYKTLAKSAKEYILEIHVTFPQEPFLFHFEKVSKRTYLDIASVNTAMLLQVDAEKIKRIDLAIGGVAPVPYYVMGASEMFVGKEVSVSTITELIDWVQTQIQPIADVRGTVAYKRLLVSQLIKAHFIRMFPSQFSLRSFL
jgi:xanthine dehydrogenase small subunit